MACSVCQNLNPPALHTLKPGQNALIWVDAAGLAGSAASGLCDECQLLSGAIELWQPGWTKTADKWRALRLEMAIDKPVQLKYLPYGTEYGNDIQLYRNDSNTISTSTFPPSIGAASVIPQSSGSPESILQIKMWHDECVGSHELCSTSSASSLPTRLTDVSGTNPKLVETATLTLARYVALSYCWGDPNSHSVVKTLKCTYAKHKAGISYESLPPALRDAIGLTRELGYQYIWIDALCIIQDDANDWLREAATMCRAYFEAALTIIASRSDGTGSGIFGDQRYHHYQTIPYKDTHVAVRSNIARDHEINVVIPLRADPDPISLRAWTFQEAVLSNRAIHITSDELRWECNTWQYCQCGHIAKKLPLKYDREHYQYENYRTWRLDDFFPATSTQDAYDMWANIWTFYTNRRLTNEQDRLVALSGLAQRFQDVLLKQFARRDTYLAGLWKGALPEQFLWYVELRYYSVLRGNKHDRPTSWRAPSWSWASMEASVNHIRNRGLRSNVDILEARTEPIAADGFGGLKSAMLRVRAPVLHGVHFDLDPNETRTSRFSSARYQEYDLRIAHSYIDNDCDAGTDKYLTDPAQEFNLLVIGYTKASDIHECMLIVPVSGKSGCFERVGLVRLGQYLREPKEHALAIENAPVEEIVLL